jgi:hypothetical protein
MQLTRAGYCELKLLDVSAIRTARR